MRMAALVLCGMVGGTACARDNGETAPGHTVQDSAGIVIVGNDHTRPQWRRADQAWRLSVEPEVQIGAVEGDAPYLLHNAFHSRRLRDGTIAVVNTFTDEVRLYDSHGLHIGTLGGRGQGPGEFRGAWNVYELAADSLIVFDLASYELSVFDETRRFVRRFRLVASRDTAVRSNELVDQFADGTFLFRLHHVAGVPGERGRERLVRYGLDGSLLDTFGDFVDQTGSVAYGAWSREGAADSTLVWGRGDRFEVSEIARDGRILRIIRLDRPNRPITEQDRADYVERSVAAARGNPELLRRLERPFPPEFPAHFDIRTDGTDHIWVQDYQPFWLRVERVWSVFDPAGRYLGDVVTPAGFDVHQIGDDFLLGRWTDELDVEYIRLYRLEKPDAAN